MFWLRQGVCYLPVFLVIWSSCTFIITYIIALLRNDVDIIFPYISDTGSTPPESCIFGLMTFISACAGIATIYARYKYVERLTVQNSLVSPCLNKFTLWLGLISCLGMCIVATFQETVVTTVHDIGAGLFFIPGVLYICFQSYISHKARPNGSSKHVFRARVGFSVIAVVAVFPTAICAIFVEKTTLHRHVEDKDFYYHVTSAICEWIVAFSFVCFFLTYIDDFKTFTLRVKAERAE